MTPESWNHFKLFAAVTGHLIFESMTYVKFGRKLEADRGTVTKMKRVFVIFCFVVGPHFNVETPCAEDTNLIAAARKEARVVWYTVAGESQQLA